jgi:hypothetical protein
LPTSVIAKKTAQRKQSLNGRIFAQSGHPAKSYLLTKKIKIQVPLLIVEKS